MNRDAARLGDGPYDLLIIGGGIIGAGAARDAATRGLRVALIEQGDFGGGTSSRSSKLVHGGLRYLEQGAIRLVREACREREVLLRIAPHLVRPLSFVFPCYRGIGRPLWKVRAGLAMYDLLAGTRVIRRHKILSVDETLRREPSLEPRNLEGAGLYYDCRMNDARLCLENILAAADAGAVVANYVRLTRFTQSNGLLDGAVAVDLESGGEIRIQARAAINAAGPWTDEIRFLDNPESPPVIRKTRGIHLVLPKLQTSGAIAWTARSDGRLLFLLPFDGAFSLLGTTDTDSREDPARPGIDPAEVEYLLTEVNEIHAGAKLRREDVLSAFAGLRTLIAGPGSPSRVTREYKIEETRSGLLSVIGGKYTTYRSIAAQVVDRALDRLGLPGRPCKTDTKLPSAPDGDLEEYIAAAERQSPGRGHLIHRYGTRAMDVMRAAREEIFPGCGVEWGEVSYAIEFEMARRPIDFLRRRTALCLTHPPDGAVLRRLCEIFQKHLGWDGEKMNRETDETRREWAAHQLRK